MARQLNAGEQFPDYKLQTATGETLNVPSDLKGDYAVLIFYRGIW